MYKKSVHCTNCGKNGHHTKGCKDPTTSLGVVCVRVDPAHHESLRAAVVGKTINLQSFNNVHNRFLDRLDEFHDSVQFLLIQRKHSLGFLEFVRGRYSVHDYKELVGLFEMMLPHEVDTIRTQSFKQLFDTVWYRCPNSALYEEELRAASFKFHVLKDKHKEYNVLSLAFYLTNIRPKFEKAEWGFPKGRRCFHERNVDCAVREFEEETNYKGDDYTILYNTSPLKEVFWGTDRNLYRHIYYLGILNNTEKEVCSTSSEVGDIGWFSFMDALDLIRPYHDQKRKVLVEALKFVLGQLCVTAST